MTLLLSFYKDSERLSNLPEITQKLGGPGCSIPRPITLGNMMCLTEQAQGAQNRSDGQAAGGGSGEEMGCPGPGRRSFSK